VQRKTPPKRCYQCWKLVKSLAAQFEPRRSE